MNDEECLRPGRIDGEEKKQVHSPYKKYDDEVMHPSRCASGSCAV